jgi:hypothetical protein
VDKLLFSGTVSAGTGTLLVSGKNAGAGSVDESTAVPVRNRTGTIPAAVVISYDCSMLYEIETLKVDENRYTWTIFVNEYPEKLSNPVEYATDALAYAAADEYTGRYWPGVKFVPRPRVKI